MVPILTQTAILPQNGKSKAFPEMLKWEMADLAVCREMLTFVTAKGRGLHPKPPSFFCSPAFGVTKPSPGFSKPSPGFSTRRVKIFTPSAVNPARRFVTTEPASGNSKPEAVRKNGTRSVTEG